MGLVVPGFPYRRDEAGLAAVVDLVERLSAVHDVHVTALRHPPRRATYRLAGARVEPLGLGQAGGATARALTLGTGLAAILRAHRRVPFDLLHGIWVDEAGATAAVAARLLRRPVVVSAMGGELVAEREIGYGAALGRGGRWTSAAALRLADVVTAGSSYLRAQVARRAPRARVVVQPLGVDTRVFSPPAAAPRGDEQRILFVGSLEPVKDPLLMVQAFATLAATHPRLRLTMAGAGSLRAAVLDEARRLGVAGRIELTGQLERSAMPDVYRSATVLCVTSRHEAQSMAAVEAAACGVPVVGTAVGVLPDLGAGAITAPVGDRASVTAALTAALAAVVDDDDLAARTGAEARSAALRLYDIDRTSESVMALYADLAGRSHGGRRRV